MSFKALAEQGRIESRELYKAIPDVMKSFQGVMASASKGGAIPASTKELLALAIAVAMRCEGCIAFHVQNAIRHGASREEFAEALGVAVEMGGGPATVYAGKALAAFDEFSA